MMADNRELLRCRRELAAATSLAGVQLQKIRKLQAECDGLRRRIAELERKMVRLVDEMVDTTEG